MLKIKDNKYIKHFITITITKHKWYVMMNTKKYVVVDIGCIECGEPSTVLGIFNDKKKAESVREKYKNIQEKNWHSKHYFEIFEVDEEDKVVNDDYYKGE